MTPAFLAAETFANPYPLARWLRDHDPVHWSTEFRAWVLTRYADVAASLHDPRLIVETRLPPLDRLAARGLEPLRPLFSTMGRMFLYRDPPDHTRLRRAMHHAFTKSAIERWRSEIERQVTALLDARAGHSGMDVLADLARPLPVSAIRHVLGIPVDIEPQLQVWSEDVSRFIGNFLQTPERLAAIQRSILEFSDYLRGLLEERRRAAASDTNLLTALARDPESQLTDDEMIANVILLIAAGHVTTTDLIGNGALALLQAPELATELREHAAEPEFMESAVEELLRCESPVQMTTRVAREDVEIGGRPIRAGDWLLLWLGAANRDPARFADPERMNLTRTDNRHLAFGAGNHFCIGASLARLQAQAALPALFRRFPAMRVKKDVPLIWEQQPALRGLTALAVDLE